MVADVLEVGWGKSAVGPTSSLRSQLNFIYGIKFKPGQLIAFEKPRP